MKARWLPDALCAFDTETTGVDVQRDRIVTAAVAHVGKRGVTRRREWLINPGIPIPERASAIHGITTEKAEAEGVSPLAAIPDIATELLSAWATGLPVVVMNAPFDLSLLNEELERVAHDRIEIGPVLDPLAIDRACEPYRKGKRTLEALCERYKVKQETAHNAMGDAITAARLVWSMAKWHADLAPMTLAEAQTVQAVMHQRWAADFEIFKRVRGEVVNINRSWPCR